MSPAVKKHGKQKYKQERTVTDLTKTRRAIGAHIAEPLVKGLSRSGIKPNALTLISCALSVAAACFITSSHFLYGAILILLSGLFDILDGALARFTSQSSKFGAILDSTLDRFSEGAIFCALVIWYLPQGATLEIIVILAVLVGSFLVSYLRARGEGVGLECKAGLFTRTERVIVVAAGLLLNQVSIALWILLIGVYITVAQRLLHLWKQRNY